MKNIPFNVPYVTGNEYYNIQKVFDNKKFCGDGNFGKEVEKKLEHIFGANKVLLTTSCTHSLEIASILLNLKEGDEVIVPSFTFVSTVNAFVLRGAKPIFIDIEENTLNLDINLIKKSITKNTKAIFIVHYAGVSCDMDKLLDICRKNNLYLVEDAAQCFGTYYKGKHLGTFGDLGCFSFHETKNIHCGEGGALVINNKSFIERAEYIREKGTNRTKFFCGQVDKYTWVDIGSSYVISELQSAFLLSQVELYNEINQKRKNVWNYYFGRLDKVKDEINIKLTNIPDYCEHNAHLFYIIVSSSEKRTILINKLKELGINAIFHYIPLHNSDYAKKNLIDLKLNITEDLSSRLIRLPLYPELTIEDQDFIVDSIYNILRNIEK